MLLTFDDIDEDGSLINNGEEEGKGCFPLAAVGGNYERREANKYK